MPRAPSRLLNGSTESRPTSSSRADSAQEYFVDVAPRPIFAGLKRSDDRMLCGVKMFGGMAIRRGVAAADMSAGQAKPEVDPGGPHLQTFLTAVRAGNDVVVNLVEVLAGL